jgi:hypothetical protein
MGWFGSGVVEVDSKRWRRWERRRRLRVWRAWSGEAVSKSRVRRAAVAAEVRRKSDWKRRVDLRDSRALMKPLLRSQRRRMPGVGQSAGAGPAGLVRKERKKRF